MQVVCKLTEFDKTTPEELLSERVVELSVDDLRPQAGTELVPRNLPSSSAHSRYDPSEAPGAYAACACIPNAKGNLPNLHRTSH